MVSTRATRSKAALPDQEQEQVPPPAATRARRIRKAPAARSASQSNRQPLTEVTAAGPSNTQPPKRRHLRSTAAPDSPLRSLEEPQRKPEKRKRATKKAPTPDPEPQQDVQDQGVFFQADLVKENSLLRAENDNLRAEKDDLRAETDLLRVENADLKKILEDSKDVAKQLEAAKLEAEYLRTENMTMRNTWTKPSPKIAQPDESAFALLHKIESAAAEARQRDGVGRKDRETTPEADDDTDVEDAHVDAEPEKEPVTPTTPRSTGWGLSGFFSRLLPSTFTSPAPAPVPVVAPATAPPALLKPGQAQDLTNTLTPTPTSTPVGEPRPRKKKTKKPNPPADRREMIKRVARSVNIEDRALATAWAKRAAKKLSRDTATIGEKRQRIENGVKISELTGFPGRKPWEPEGSYGLGDAFYDYDSDDEAPAWMILQDMVDEMDAAEMPASKKHKSDHDVTMDEDLTSLNDADHPTGNISHQPLIDTHGNSTSLADLHPRPAHIPSPMFDDPTHEQGDNVFSKVHDQALPASDKELRRAGHVADPGSFSVPDSDSDDDTEDGAEDGAPETTPLWTQQPPPAPTPAHASLPAPLAAVPSVPVVQAFDPVERQRARLMKHTPAKPSRLREAIIPSPSLKSDAGNDSVLVTTPVRVVGELAMPDAEPLDLDDEIMTAADALIASDAYKAQTDTAYSADVILVYDEDSDEEL